MRDLYNIIVGWVVIVQCMVQLACSWLGSRTSGTVQQGVTVVTPYVEVARKQSGGLIGCISNYTAIPRLGAGFAHF